MIIFIKIITFKSYVNELKLKTVCMFQAHPDPLDLLDQLVSLMYIYSCVQINLLYVKLS